MKSVWNWLLVMLHIRSKRTPVTSQDIRNILDGTVVSHAHQLMSQEAAEALLLAMIKKEHLKDLLP